MLENILKTKVEKLVVVGGLVIKLTVKGDSVIDQTVNGHRVDTPLFTDHSMSSVILKNKNKVINLDDPLVKINREAKYDLDNRTIIHRVESELSSRKDSKALRELLKSNFFDEDEFLEEYIAEKLNAEKTFKKKLGNLVKKCSDIFDTLSKKLAPSKIDISKDKYYQHSIAKVEEPASTILDNKVAKEMIAKSSSDVIEDSISSEIPEKNGMMNIIDGSDFLEKTELKDQISKESLQLIMDIQDKYTPEQINAQIQAFNKTNPVQEVKTSVNPSLK